MAVRLALIYTGGDESSTLLAVGFIVFVVLVAVVIGLLWRLADRRGR